MKKGNMYSGTVTEVKFPNKGVVRAEERIDKETGTVSPIDDDGAETCIVKNVVSGQRVTFVVNKKKGGRCEGRLVDVLVKSPDECEPACRYFGICGGCTYQNLPYEKQRELTDDPVKSPVAPVVTGRHGFFQGR